IRALSSSILQNPGDHATRK
ncbi:hypothetical protein AZ025_003743, partial [Escherichia coli]